MTLQTLARGETHRRAGLLKSLSLSSGGEYLDAVGQEPGLRGKQLLRRECRVGDAVAKHSPVDADPRHPLVAVALVSFGYLAKSKRS